MHALRGLKLFRVSCAKLANRSAIDGWTGPVRKSLYERARVKGPGNHAICFAGHRNSTVCMTVLPMLNWCWICDPGGSQRNPTIAVAVVPVAITCRTRKG